MTPRRSWPKPARTSRARKRPEVDPKKIAAIGYCFGGSVVLDMLRAGETFPLVATFHGALSTKQTIKPGNKSRVLVLHGAADHFGVIDDLV